VSYETAIQQWRQGSRRLGEAGPAEARVLHRVTEAIHAELRRRLGSTFMVDELVDLYEQGTDWAHQLAMRTAPEDPWAWEPRTVVDAAFARHLRDASDYAGGRRLIPDA
jgi:hypothetical protein